MKDRIEKGIAVSQKKQQTHLKTTALFRLKPRTQRQHQRIEPRKEENARTVNTNQLPPRRKKNAKGSLQKCGAGQKSYYGSHSHYSCICGSGKKWTKKAAVVTGLAFVGYFGGKFVQNQFSKADDNAKQNKTEVTVKQQQPVQQKVSKSQKNKESKTADFTKEMSALEKAYKNRFDTALKIILGETARDKLYQQVDSLEKAGKIEYKDGTTREWYAHAFTMYNQLAPNSKENKAVKNLLSGGNEDKAYIHSLVIQSGRDGRGIQASGTYSAFDHADKKLQQQHLKNRKAVKLAEQAALAKAQHTR